MLFICGYQFLNQFLHAFIHILLKGLKKDDAEGKFISGMDFDTITKSMCNSANFILLETDQKGDQQGDDCVVGGMTYANCDCSDPENYNFYDEGRFLKVNLAVISHHDL